MKQASEQTGWKKKLVHETNEFLFNFVYMAFFFSCFTWYRRLILAEYHITYMHYGISIIQALILAKVVMIGDILGLGKLLEKKAALLLVLYKTAVFTVWVAVFAIVEHTIEGLVHGKSLAQSFLQIFNAGYDELLSRCLVVFAAFIPFFILKEINKICGYRNI
jgi:hypothetical protein